MQRPVERPGDDGRGAERDDRADGHAVRGRAREERGLVGEHAGGADRDERPGRQPARARGERMPRGIAARRRGGCPGRIAPTRGEVDGECDEPERAAAHDEPCRAERERAGVGAEGLRRAGGAEAHGGEQHGEHETHCHIVTQSAALTAAG